jgi:CMP-N,N'-diacetyllegionaminic acid synthase
LSPSLLIIVPARGGSRRLPGKNRKMLAGKSLLARTADVINEASLGAPVLLTTDDEQTAADGKKFGWMVPFLRPGELATDESPTIDAVIHALDWYRDQGRGADPASIMVLQPTSALRGARCLTVAYELLRTRADVDSIVAMTAIDLPVNHMYLCGKDGLASPVLNDNRKPVYVPNGALYLARTSAVRGARSLYTSKLLPIVIDKLRAIDIDTDIDWRLAEAAFAAGLPPDNASAATCSSAGKT